MTTATNTDRILKGDHMTTIRPLHRDTYICAYRSELLRLFGKRTRVNGHDVDDIVSYVVGLHHSLARAHDSPVRSTPMT